MSSGLLASSSSPYPRLPVLERDGQETQNIKSHQEAVDFSYSIEPRSMERAITRQRVNFQACNPNHMASIYGVLRTNNGEILDFLPQRGRQVARLRSSQAEVCVNLCNGLHEYGLALY